MPLAHGPGVGAAFQREAPAAVPLPGAVGPLLEHGTGAVGASEGDPAVVDGQADVEQRRPADAEGADALITRVVGADDGEGGGHPEELDVAVAQEEVAVGEADRVVDEARVGRLAVHLDGLHVDQVGGLVEPPLLERGVDHGVGHGGHAVAVELVRLHEVVVHDLHEGTVRLPGGDQLVERGQRRVDGNCDPLQAGMTTLALFTVVVSVLTSRSDRVCVPVTKAARSLMLALVTDMAQYVTSVAVGANPGGCGVGGYSGMGTLDSESSSPTVASTSFVKPPGRR